MVEDTFGDDEPTSQRHPALTPFLLDTLKDMLKTLHVIVIIPTDGAARNLQTLLDGEVDCAVGDDDVTALTKGRND